jgi:protein required for attachment to host cells
MKLEHDTCVLVADGAKMMFFRNAGDAQYPKLEIDGKRVDDSPPDRDQKSDADGYTHRSAGPGGSTMGTTDFHTQEEERFAAETADLLKRRAMAHHFEKLIVVAPPQTLGELRKHYHDEVERRLVGEIGKDLTRHPVAEIERIIIAA